ncbi:YafY family transcriptional regulator [Spiractinospora alimapuensis]|nr:YafY family transcriptional regulator [Spiractinospora alimapuensis]
MPGRILRLLSLLQNGRVWSGAQLSDRLDASPRTVRRDVDRLRALDYPVEATTGTGGGYRLAAGERMPPLQLDDEEVVAIAVALVTVGSSNVARVSESATRALATLGQVLPPRLRPRVDALARTASAVPHRSFGPPVDPPLLAALARSCRDTEGLRFDYSDRDGRETRRRVEPHHLVAMRGHWYLLAFDLDRSDWRVFRADRLSSLFPTGRRFTPRDLPEVDPTTVVERAFATARYAHTAWMEVALPAEHVRTHLLAPPLGEIQERGPGTCGVRVSAESPDLVTQYVAAVAALGADFSLCATDEVEARVRGVGRRLTDPPRPPHDPAEDGGAAADHRPRRGRPPADAADASPHAPPD